MTDDANENSSGVGYKKPPDKYRFKPGRSGNPAGRPKGSKNRKCASDLDIAQLILDAAAETHEFRQGDTVVTLSRAKAIVDSISVKALKGDPRSQKLFMDLTTSASAKKWKAQADLIGDAIGYKERAASLIDSLNAAGKSSRHVLPHPDDVVIDFSTNEVSTKGPRSKDEREFLEFLLEREDAWEKEVAHFERALSKKLSAADRAMYEQDLKMALETVEEFHTMIEGTWPNSQLVVQHDELVFGKEIVRKHRAIGLGRPTRDVRELVARRRGFEERKKRAEGK